MKTILEKRVKKLQAQRLALSAALLNITERAYAISGNEAYHCVPSQCIKKAKRVYRQIWRRA